MKLTSLPIKTNHHLPNQTKVTPPTKINKD
jgi:hypothetical protein